MASPKPLSLEAEEPESEPQIMQAVESARSGSTEEQTQLASVNLRGAFGGGMRAQRHFIGTSE